MSSTGLLVVVFGYFAVLLAIAWYTSRGAGEHAFYSGERKSIWWVVAFGMVGTSLSGVTFVSVPGSVARDHWHYLQMIFGFVIGYWIIAGVLLPLYYRLELTSIYGYLRSRFGLTSYRTGSAIFIISRLLGATVRIYVVLYVIHSYLLQSMGVPFWLTSSAVLLMIFLYTLQGGVKTIVWTDTLQTLFMLAALVGTIVYIITDPLMSKWPGELADSGMTEIFNWKIKDRLNFFKQLISGIFVTIVMTGLDQEMMQKNLSVRTLADAQKNMRVFSVVMLLTNLLFLFLGALLYLKVAQMGISLPAKSDDLFPTLALQHFPPLLGLLFIVGLISALFPSADGALTALTASTCIDLIGIRERGWTDAQQRRVRQTVHALIACLFLVLVMWFYIRQDDSIITLLYGLAAITYGPLLGLFSFGLFSHRKPREALVPLVCIAAAVASFLLRRYSRDLFWDYEIGFETLPINGLITYIGLWLISRPPAEQP
ncbi:MAG: sodium:solute symporter [Pirellulaceae bacterium]|nr:sodium:solute symporter [Pirellulaceae bacterium]